MRKRYKREEIIKILKDAGLDFYESHNGSFNRFFVEVNDSYALFAKNSSKDIKYILCNQFEEIYGGQ